MIKLNITIDQEIFKKQIRHVNHQIREIWSKIQQTENALMLNLVRFDDIEHFNVEPWEHMVNAKSKILYLMNELEDLKLAAISKHALRWDEKYQQLMAINNFSNKSQIWSYGKIDERILAINEEINRLEKSREYERFMHLLSQETLLTFMQKRKNMAVSAIRPLLQCASKTLGKKWNEQAQRLNS